MGSNAQNRAHNKMGLSCLMEEKKKEDLSKEEQRELLKNLRERIKQLRMVEYIDDDEEPDVFIGDGI